ncbi:hypothetical protein [Streptomyces sp. HUAS TT7]|uniref:hypothetical protein n=1 Tax=Streptomyces sp. HUAS TT7 TaxID=3447507 RepID=UPI003F65559A
MFFPRARQSTHATGRPTAWRAATAGALVLPLALLALEIRAGSTAQARTHEPLNGGQGIAAEAVAHGTKAPLAATVSEGQVKEVAPGGVITYPSVTSCLTVTVRLRGGGLVGAHASLFQVPGELRSDEILPALKALVGGRPVASIEVKGAVGAWHPSYFTKSIESYGDGEQVPVPSGQDVAGIARAVADGLGRARHIVTVQDVPDGDQIVR